MKEIFKIDDSFTNKVTYYHLLFFVISLPFDRFYSELLLISLLIHTLIHFRKEKLRLPGKPGLLLIAPFIVALLASTYALNKSNAFSDLGKELAILLFPLLLPMSGLDLGKYRSRILKAFAITCTVTIAWLYVYNLLIIHYNHFPITYIGSSFFTNHAFSRSIELHATYFSMYVALSVTTVVYLFIHAKTFSARLPWMIALCILLAGLLQLSSRAVFIAMLVILNLAIPLLMLKPRYRLKFYLISGSLTLITIASLLTIDNFKERYITDLKEDLSQLSDNSDLLEPRMMRWKAAMKPIGKSPLIGYGTGNETRVLKEEYYDNRLYVSFLNEFNAHNQYIGLLVRSGIIGLAVYLYLMCFGFANAWLAKDPFFFSFMVIIAVVSFSENILDVNKGIFFYSFFFSFFIFSLKRPVVFPGLQKKDKNIQSASL